MVSILRLVRTGSLRNERSSESVLRGEAMAHLAQVVAPVMTRIESADVHPFPDQQVRFARRGAACGDEPVRVVLVDSARKGVGVGV
jgi:beta-phosphoglucomutase-like phosphatase (HAD superfamily)